LHLAELLPRRRLVLARAEVEDEVVLRGDVLADVGDPRRAAVGADVALAGVAARAAGAALEAAVDAVLMVLGRHLVDAERAEFDTEPAAGVLHPVLVDGVPAVEGV